MVVNRPAIRAPRSTTLLFAASLLVTGGCETAALRATTGTQQTSFVQAPHEIVDVLWVVDDSSPFMAGFQGALGDATDALVAPLQGLDVQMAVVPTTLGTPLEPFQWAGTDADVAWLADELQVGATGSDQERGLQAAAEALAPELGFVRPEGHLVVVFASDEEDCSHQGGIDKTLGSACYTAALELDPVRDFVDFFTGLHGGARNRVTVVSIGAGMASTCDEPIPQERYARVARATGGPVLDLCADPRSHLEVVGDIASGLRSAFQLPSPAQPASIGVTVDRAPETRFVYRPETWIIEFPREAVPRRGATIHLVYEVDPTMFTTEP